MLKVMSVPVGFLMTNCYVITDEESGISAVIDPGEFTPQLDEALKSIGYDTIKYIILTHGHYDHIGGVNKILEKPGCKAKVAISADDMPLLSDGFLNLSQMFTGETLQEVKADIALKDGEIISVGKSDFKVMCTPGHTEGSICLIGDGVIFSGDTLFFRSAGRTDFPTGSSGKMMQSLQRLAQLEGDYIVYTGHNQQTSLAQEKKNNPYMGRNNYDDLY